MLLRLSNRGKKNLTPFTLDHVTELESQNEINQDYFYSGSHAGMLYLSLLNRLIHNLKTCQHLKRSLCHVMTAGH